MQILKKIEKVEIFLILGVIISAIFFSKFPTLFNALDTPAGFWFPKQTSWYDAWDTNFQVSYMRFGQRYGVLLQNTYTTIPHKGVFVYHFYTILGVVNRIFQLDPFLLFHLASIAMTILLILVCYYVVRIFFRDQLYRIAAFITVVLGGGVGFLPFLAQFSSADTQVAGFTLINAFERGHDAFSTLLLLLTFSFIFLFVKTRQKKYITYSLLSSFLSITMHPPFAAMYLVTGILVCLYLFRKNGKLDFISYPIWVLVLFAIYYLIVLFPLSQSPGFAGVVGQNLFSVDTLMLVLGFGIASFFLGWTLFFSKNDEEEIIFAKLFFLIQLFFTLLPLGFHLYYVKGLHTWGMILVFLGIRDFIASRQLQRTIVIFVVMISLLTRIYVFNTLLHASPQNSFFFLTKNEGKALDFISTLPADTAVLSLYRIGNYIPAFSNLKVYYGHKFQTPNNQETLRNAGAFYTKMNEKEQREFLQKNNINYIYYGLEEARLRKDENLPAENPFSYFDTVYQNNSIIVYTVTSLPDQIKSF